MGQHSDVGITDATSHFKKFSINLVLSKVSYPADAGLSSMLDLTPMLCCIYISQFWCLAETAQGSIMCRQCEALILEDQTHSSRFVPGHPSAASLFPPECAVQAAWPPTSRRAARGSRRPQRGRPHSPGGKQQPTNTSTSRGTILHIC